jgi:glycosyltransferase involved in cell wall biosynthesis
MNIAIFHNIMWSKYKGGVFSALNELTERTATHVTYTQIAETESGRALLGGVDLTYHRYPFELIFQGPYTGVSTLRRTMALASRAWKSTADVVVMPGYERIEYWVMLAVLVLRRKPRAVFCDSTANDRPSHPLKKLAKRLFFSLCDGFFAYGTRSREYLMLHGAPSSKIFFHCQAAAMPHHYSEAWALERRLAEAPRAGEPARFLYVGRLSPEKGLDTLIAAMKRVVAVQPKAILDIVGAGPTKEALQLAIAQAGLSESIFLPGSMDISQLAAKYAGATALVLPSTSEPWGLVVNEALSHGCPVVASHICGCIPELVKEGTTGYVFQAGQVDDLAEKMLRAHEQFQDAEKTANACIVLMRQFTPTEAAKQILAGCKEIVQHTAA